MKFCLALAVSLGLISSAMAESVNPKSADPSVAAELVSFTVHEEFEVSLFADETLGVANPIAMHWDEQGRLWVLTTLAYAQLSPGQKPNDKIYILEDTDGDGKADASTVFAEGLDMPIGFALAEGGVYVGEGDKLIFIDSDGRKEVILRGFGTGDTHQNISNFTWGPDGCLYFSQGLHCYSRVETPWGIVRGDTAGFFRFNPNSLKLEPFCFPSMASQNPCGIAFDKHGSMFLKSNNKELIYVTPGLVPTTHSRNLEAIASLGSTPGKSMGAEYVESTHLPDWLQHHMLVSGYYSHRLTAFPLIEEGAGYRQVEPVELLVSDHPSFRPVDSRIGPDGAIYVADWFNPIIGHYQASLRHPDRDKQHGRIWRITAKNRPLMVNRPPRLQPGVAGLGNPLTKAPPVDGSPETQARQRLHEVVRLANLPEAESLPKALQALDHQPDRFIDYALRQSVHALAEYWLPAVSAGKLKFEKPQHLAFALEEIGGEQAVTLARAKLADASIDATVRQRFAAVLAKVGSAEDLRKLLMEDHADGAVLNALNEAWATRKVRAADPFAPRLAELVASESESVKVAAIRLVGLWRVMPLTAAVKKLALDSTATETVRIEAMQAFARLAGKASVEPLLTVASAGDKISSRLQVASVQALSLVDLARAGGSAAEILPTLKSDAEIGRLLQAFLVRKGGSDALAAALQTAGLTVDDARRVSTALSEVGRRSGELAAVVDAALGTAANATPYSVEFVNELVAEVNASGDAEAGKEIFQRPLLTCVACHQVGGAGGILGPSLDTVGAGLPLDILIESVLWPERQLKEGYFALSVSTKDGRELTGYREREQAGVLHLRDTASGVTHPIPAGQIAERKNIGTLMPAGLTTSLKREELRNLIAYLASLKGGR